MLPRSHLALLPSQRASTRITRSRRPGECARIEPLSSLTAFSKADAPIHPFACSTSRSVTEYEQAAQAPPCARGLSPPHWPPPHSPASRSVLRVTGSRSPERRKANLSSDYQGVEQREDRNTAKPQLQAVPLMAWRLPDYAASKCLFHSLLILCRRIP
jgi:hypothetical protein